MTELADLTVTEAVTRIRQGEICARDLVDAALDRAAYTNPVVYAYSTLDADAARLAADAADLAQRRGEPLGPLHGVPLAVDDLLDVAGMPTTKGARALAAGAAAADAAEVRALRQAGAIVLGKTWTHEFGLPTSVPPTRNAWDPRRAPGASSAGSAVAVAVGSAAAAVGVDTGGSQRIPAALNGVVAFTPTRPVEGASATVISSPALDVFGTIARWAADALLLVDVATGRAPGAMDPPVLLDDLREYAVGALTFGALGSPSPAVAAAVERVVSLFADGGATITSVRWPHPGLAGAVGTAFAFGDAADHHRDLLRSSWRELEPATVARLVAGATLPESVRQGAGRLQKLVCADVDAAFDMVRSGRGTPVLAMPAFPTAPGPAHDPFAGYAAALPLATEIHMLVSLAGLPAVILPCGLGAEGMPAAIHLVAPRGADRSLLRLALWLQQHSGWHRQSPLTHTGEGVEQPDDDEMPPIGLGPEASGPIPVGLSAPGRPS